MPSGSPAVVRVISILNFFISHPKDSFTLAQIVKSLKISRATCFAIMTSLVDAGYLYRSSDKRYLLGPAILTIARRTQMASTPMDIARPEIRKLADRLDAVVSVQIIENNMVVSHERAASVRHLSLAYPAEMSHTVHPWGVPFLSALEDYQVEAEFDKAIPPLSKSDKAFERSLIAFTRQHGFLFAINPDEAIKQQRIKTGTWSMGVFLPAAIHARTDHRTGSHCCVSARVIGL
jgi:DNA-binding IclR family transcriptional regulator